jgi:hypothetical protein
MGELGLTAIGAKSAVQQISESQAGPPLCPLGYRFTAPHGHEKAPPGGAGLGGEGRVVSLHVPVYYSVPYYERYFKAYPKA